MSRFPSLPERPVLADVFKRFPRVVAPLFEYHDLLLRGPSPLSIAQRELIAAFVSALNSCGYCAGAHRSIAEIHGIAPETLDALLAGSEGADVDPKLRPILAYVRKLTLSPSKVIDADAQAVFAAGWDEEALFHAISVCGLFNLMNRIVEGCAIRSDTEVLAEQRSRHTALMDDPHPYQTFGRRLGVIP